VTHEGLITFVRLSFASIPKLQLPPTVLMVCLRRLDRRAARPEGRRSLLLWDEKGATKTANKRYYYDDQG